MQQLLSWAVLLLILYWIIILGIQYYIIIDPSSGANLQIFQNKLESAGVAAWNFAAPFLQLIILLIILDFILSRSGFKFQLVKDAISTTDIQKPIALLVVTTFCFAALGGIGSTESLKELALIVVGFYFGSVKRESENKQEAEKHSE